MFSKLYITIKANKCLDNSIIDSISFILINWGVDGNLIDWDIYPDRAKLEINTEADNYKSYCITFQGMNSIMELCYEEEFIMTIIDNNGTNETYTTYLSEPKSSDFATDVTELVES